MNAPARVVLVVSNGEEAGREFVVTGDAIAGRSPKVEVALVKDIKASRQHAKFRLAGGKLTVGDMGSANGTLINGKKIAGDETLFDGDKVLVGETLLLVRAPELSRAKKQTAARPAADDVDPAAATQRLPDAPQTAKPAAPQPAPQSAKPAAKPSDVVPASKPKPSDVNPAAAVDLGAELDLDAEVSDPVPKSAAPKPTERKPAAAPAKPKPPREPQAPGDVAWTAKPVLRAAGSENPRSLVQRLLGDRGLLTDSVGNQSTLAQVLLGTGLLLLFGLLFLLSMWMFGGCDPGPVRTQTGDTTLSR